LELLAAWLKNWEFQTQIPVTKNTPKKREKRKKKPLGEAARGQNLSITSSREGETNTPSVLQKKEKKA